ncbi:MAG: ABC transporter ATP-binding protein [Comamonadaceae bacterium]|nr:MAG: ABC transporter ATP-binding protein [Comamonadaceae bacterium]
MDGTQPLLQVENLRISVRGPAGFHGVVRDLSFRVDSGQTLAIVGESGCGKSITALSILGLLAAGSVRVDSGRILFEGDDLLRKTEREMCALRGNRIAMIFQEPMNSLNPVLTVGDQIAETVRVHQGLSSRDAWRQAIDALDMVRIPDAARRARQYPHQLSGGMRQRVMIAMALACRSRLIIADEPTTALDVTIQAQILALLSELQSELGTAIVLITHDLGVVCETADRVIVLYAGARAEEASALQLFDAPGHPYTQGLMASIPRRALQQGAQRLNEIPGVVPPPDQLGAGCAFAGRCPRVLEVCRTQPPVVYTPAPGHQIACFNPLLQGAAHAAA